MMVELVDAEEEVGAEGKGVVAYVVAVGYH